MALSVGTLSLSRTARCNSRNWLLVFWIGRFPRTSNSAPIALGPAPPAAIAAARFLHLLIVPLNGLEYCTSRCYYSHVHFVAALLRKCSKGRNSVATWLFRNRD